MYAFPTGSLHQAPRLAALAGVLGLAGCGGQGLTQTGFLPDYARMQAQSAHTSDAIYVKPGYSPASYTKVIVEPTAWVPASDTPVREPQVISELSTSFHENLVKKLSERYTVVANPGQGQDPGPGVLRVQSAITNTRRAHWYVNAPVAVASIGLSAVGLFGAPLAPSKGGASEEMLVTDARTAEPVVEVATYNNGMPWNVVGDYVTYGHARRAFRLASDLLSEEVSNGGEAAASVQSGSRPVAVLSAPFSSTLAQNTSR